MAEKKPSILGEFSGRIGNIVIKKRNGKTYASKAASKYTISQLPHEIDKRNIQTVNGKFASVINSSRLLKSIWYKEKAPCVNAYNKINKVNYHLCAPDHPTEKAQITPGGFKLEVNEINVKPDKLEITLRPIKLQKDETQVAYIMILSLWNPRAKRTAPFEFLMPENYTAEAAQLTFRLNKDEAALAKKYCSKTIFLAAVTLDDTYSVRRWSETRARDIS